MTPVTLPNERFEALTTDFWEYNPHLKSLRSFRALIKLDQEYPQTENETSWSSRVMWAIYFESDPDEERNPFISLDLIEIRGELTDTMFTDAAPLPYDMDEFAEASDLYTELCMSPVERALRDEIRSMQKRARIIRDTPLVFDETIPIYKQIPIKVSRSEQWETLLKRKLIKEMPENVCEVCCTGEGFVITDVLDKKVEIKGTIKELEGMRKSTPGLIAQYKKLEAMFQASKAETHVYGNQSESLSDKGVI